MPDTNIEPQSIPAPTYRNRSVEIKDLAAALVKAQAAMEGAKKDADNPAFKTSDKPKGSKYADLASVWEAVRKPLTDNDLCVVQFPRTAGNGVEIETTILHGKTGQFMCDVLWVPCGKNDAQGLGSAITYGRRYALMAVTGIAPVDDDGNAAVATTSAGVPGSAGGGSQFRPERRAGSMAPARGEADVPNGTTPAPKAKLPPGNARAPTVEEARAAKVKAAVDKRIRFLKNGGTWTGPELQQWATDDEEWVSWMADPKNNVADEYKRYTDAYAAAEATVRQVA